MINISTMSRLTNSELLRALDERKGNSPIISELCKRLDDLNEEIKDTNHSVECPVCMASLNADIDYDNNLFTLEVSKS